MHINYSILKIFKPIVPFGVFESWDDLNPRLYHAIHIYCLKFYGLWYNNYSPNSIMYWIKLFYTILVLWLVGIFPGYGETIYLLRRKEDIGGVVEGLYIYLSEMYMFAKVAAFWINKKKVLALLDYLKCEEFKPKEEEHREILLRSIRRARFIMSGYTTVCLGAIANICWYPVLVGIIMPATENFEMLPTNVEYPFLDVYKTPTYELLYIQQIYYKPAICIIDAVMDTIVASFIVCAIGQMEILSFNLERVREVAERRRMRSLAETGHAQSSEYYVKDVLRDCIIHHNSIIRYVSILEGAFSAAAACQFMLSAIVLCLIGVQLLSIENPASHPGQMMWIAIYLTCMTIEVFIMCWFGNELIWKSGLLQEAAYSGDWTTMSPSCTIYLKIFRERCQRPLTVTAGKIFTLSLDSYTILINWAYKAFALMSNMKK